MFEFLQDPFLIAFFIVGVVLLVTGKRLLWLLAAVVGFFVAFSLVQSSLPDLGLELRLGVAGLVGLLAAGLALLVQKVGVGLVGAGVGGFSVFWLLSNAGYQVSGLGWLAVAVGAVVGLLLGRGVFKLGLAVLSSVAGAALILEALGGGTAYQPLVLLGIAAVGVMIQVFSGRKSK